jgi:UDP-hydrolysing UDP-N-acetyl-D-glucosamine 2-epimerase
MRVAVFTSGRHDANVLEPVVEAMNASPTLEPVVIAAGIHFRGGTAPDHLWGAPIVEGLDTLQASDRAVAVAQTAGWTTALMAGALERTRAEALLLVGDRTETLAAAVAAVCLRVPVIHLHGGEETEGAIDNLCRHAISKLASLHFVAHPAYASRLVRMGEQPDCVIVSGAPALDLVARSSPLDDAALARAIGREGLGSPLAVFTYHPTTLGEATPRAEIAVVLEALQDWLAECPDALVVTTRPNQDEGGNAIWEALGEFAGRHPGQVALVEALRDAYYPMLRRADLMVGNSSSGLLEAPSFALPAVNIGDRQRGRLRGANVIDAPLARGAILEALRRAADPRCRTELAALANPFGDGRAAPRIAEAIAAFASTPAHRRSRKRFYDSETAG